jgi:hypothetical protein
MPALAGDFDGGIEPMKQLACPKLLSRRDA